MTLMTGIKKNPTHSNFPPPTQPLLLTTTILLCAFHQPSCRGMAINRCALVFFHSVCTTGILQLTHSFEPWLFCLVPECVYTSANIYITLYMLDGDFLWSRADVCECVCVFYTSRKVLNIAYCLIVLASVWKEPVWGEGEKLFHLYVNEPNDHLVSLKMSPSISIHLHDSAQ